MAQNFTGQIIDNIFLSKIDAPIGSIRSSDLPVAEFLVQSVGQWMLMDGQACNGTEYQTLTGKNNVPNALTEGTFLRQAKAGRLTGTYEADEIVSHRHSISPSVQNFSGGTTAGNGGDGDGTAVTQTALTGGAETRPKNLAVNYFIKVSHA